MITDAGGVPLAALVTAANVHDVTQALSLVTGIAPVAGKPGAPKWKPAALVADKAYDCQPLRDLLSWLGIEPRLARRRCATRGLGRQRWPVERTLSWLHQLRRLGTRWDRLTLVHEAFLDLGMSLVCYRILRNGFC